jgi:hypothetical protein
MSDPAATREVNNKDPLVTRAVVTEEDANNPNNGLPNDADTYVTKIIKLIPAEIVAFYTLYLGIPQSVKGEWHTALLILGVAAGIIATPAFLMKVYGLTWKYKKLQMINSTFAFILWAGSLAVYSQDLPYVPAVAATAVLAIYTGIIAPLIPPGNNTSGVTSHA